MFHDLSPGSAFFLPAGTRIYKTLEDFMRTECIKRGYQEVVTPNVFNMKLWETSGHAAKYKENMFLFEVEGQEFGMKPMNCPGHCLMFKNSLKSYRELPIRFMDFGVLHRNELSGALTGLTRVRRFQQDDGHIFCRQDQIQSEIMGVLELLKSVYDVFGFTFELQLSTRPEMFLGEIATWDNAELALAESLTAFGQPWTINPADGAFYGPKIDIKIMDALKRKHQCATIQLDFQLPQRFELEYKCEEAGSFDRPVMIHRAILGSVERMFAVLLESFAAKWPFWLSPVQVAVIPVHQDTYGYAQEIGDQLKAAGYWVEVDDSKKRFPKKMLEAQRALFNYILIVGVSEQEKGSVNVRPRGSEDSEEMPFAKFLELCARARDTKDINV
jgi:threonyl-tRNA synthetase